MRLNYKEELNSCISYLQKLEEEATSAEKADTIASYAQAIIAAKNTIEFYEARESILRVQKGQAFIDALDIAWYQQVTSSINERFGIGFDDKGETAEDD